MAAIYTDIRICQAVYRSLVVNRRSVRVVVALSAVAALAGCGGGDGGGSEAKFDPGPAQIAKPGSTVALGERAFVRYAGLGAKLEPTVKTTLGVTVMEVDEGNNDDIDGLGDNIVPYYVHVEYENHGDGAIQARGPGGRFTISGSDGETYDTTGVISIGGDFDACPRGDPQATLEPEQAIADCVVISLVEGVSPQDVRFQGDYAVDQEPVGWKVE
jgi:hypothetical protein